MDTKNVLPATIRLQTLSGVNHNFCPYLDNSQVTSHKKDSHVSISIRFLWSLCASVWTCCVTSPVPRASLSTCCTHFIRLYYLLLYPQIVLTSPVFILTILSAECTHFPRHYYFLLYPRIVLTSPGFITYYSFHRLYSLPPELLLAPYPMTVLTSHGFITHYFIHKLYSLSPA